MVSRPTSGQSGRAYPRPRLIATLLVLLLVLVTGLAWQATVAVRMHEKTSEGVLEDHARLALDEYARRTMAAVGYYGYYETIAELRNLSGVATVLPFDIPVPEAGSQAASTRRLVRWFWQYNLEEGSSYAPGVSSAVDHRVLRVLAGRASELERVPLPEAGFVVGRLLIDDREVTYVASRDENDRNLFGFVVDEAELGLRLEQVFAQAPLLPASLAEDLEGNDYLQLRHTDSAGNTLFLSGDGFGNPPAAARRLGDEYNGVFAGHTLSVAIDPAVAGSLIIGGLPRSRLPVLLTIISITAVLLAFTFRQLLGE